MTRLLLIALGCALLACPAMADEEPGEPVGTLQFVLGTDQEQLLVGGTLNLRPGWHSQYSYTIDPLTHNGPGPGEMLPMLADIGDILDLSLYQAADSTVITYVPGGPEDGRQNRWPEHPSEAIYTAKFGDGTELFLRLSEDWPSPRGWANWQGESVVLEPMTPLGFALRQMQGTPAPDAAASRENWPGFGWVAAADVRSLISSSTGTGQQEAFEFAHQAVRTLIEEYHSEHGEYPARLEDLWQGSNAVVSRSPGNPYSWPEPLCITQPASSTTLGYRRIHMVPPGGTEATDSYELGWKMTTGEG